MRRMLWFALAALALTACKVDAHVAVVVHDDGSGTVTLDVTADADVVREAPGLASDLRFDDATAAGWVVTPAAATPDGGLRVVLSHPFATVEEATALLRSLNGAAGPLHDVTLARTTAGGSITTSATGTLRIDGGLDAFADQELLAAVGATPYAGGIAAAGITAGQAVTLSFSLTMPGAMTSTSGEQAAGTVTWTVPLDGTSAEIAARGVRDGGAGAWGAVATIALVLLVVWCIVAAGFVVFVVRARQVRARRRATAPAAPRRR